MASNTLASSEYAEQLAATEFIRRVNFDAALGPLRQYLEDESVQDISVNPDGAIWVSHGARGKVRAPETMGARQRETLIGMLANRQGAVVDRLHSRLAGDFPQDYYRVRFQAFAPPVGDWALCLRLHAQDVASLDERADMFEPAVGGSHGAPAPAPGYRAALEAAIRRQDNIAIVGRPGSGKTSLLNSMLRYAAQVRPDARLVSLEDRIELRSSFPDSLALYAKVEQAAPDGTRYEYTFSDLLADSLRTSFDVLAFGELRDSASAIALLMALNTGTSGLLFTLHATGAAEALTRLEDLVRLAGAPVIRRTIARFVNVLVFLEMDRQRHRRVADVVRVLGVDERDEYIVQRVSGGF